MDVVVTLGSADPVRNLAKDIPDLRAHEEQNSHDDDHDKDEDQCVFYEPLSFLVRGQIQHTDAS